MANWIGKEWVCEPEGALASKLVGVTDDKLDTRGCHGWQTGSERSGRVSQRAHWPANSWVSRVTNWIGEEWVCEPEGDLASKLVGVTGDKLDQGGVCVCVCVCVCATWPANSWVSRMTNWIGEKWVCEP